LRIEPNFRSRCGAKVKANSSPALWVKLRLLPFSFFLLIWGEDAEGLDGRKGRKDSEEKGEEGLLFFVGRKIPGLAA